MTGIMPAMVDRGLSRVNFPAERRDVRGWDLVTERKVRFIEVPKIVTMSRCTSSRWLKLSLQCVPCLIAKSAALLVHRACSAKHQVDRTQGNAWPDTRQFVVCSYSSRDAPVLQLHYVCSAPPQDRLVSLLSACRSFTLVVYREDPAVRRAIDCPLDDVGGRTRGDGALSNGRNCAW